MNTKKRVATMIISTCLLNVFALNQTSAEETQADSKCLPGQTHYRIDQHYPWRKGSKYKPCANIKLELTESSNNSSSLVLDDKQQWINATNIQFAYNQDELDVKALKVIERLAAQLRLRPDAKIKIEGHTDNHGSQAYNLDLSKRRAKAVADALYLQGVVKTQLLIEHFGESRPIASNETERGRADNRRVQAEMLVSDIAQIDP